jgi:hypothetical protein
MGSNGSSSGGSHIVEQDLLPPATWLPPAQLKLLMAVHCHLSGAAEIPLAPSSRFRSAPAAGMSS